MLPRESRLAAPPSFSAFRVPRIPALLLLLVPLLSSACTKVPLFAPTGSSITLSASRTIAPLNSTVEITAVVQEAAGTAPQNGTLVTFSSNLGTFEPREARTTAGQVRVTFNTGGQSGTATVVATSGAAKTASTGDAALKIVIGAAAANSVVGSADPSSVASTGGTATISASALDESGNPLPGVPISFSADAGTLSATSAVSDSGGVAKVQLTTSKAATVTATAGAKNVQIKVGVNSAPTVTLAAVTTSPTAGAPFSFTVTPNTGTTPSVTVDFGDNTTQDLGVVTAVRTVTHTYASQGSYIITAKSKDAATDESASTTLAVTIGARPVATVALAATPSTVAAGGQVTFTITPTVGTGALPVQNVRFEAGDGTTRDLGAITGAATIVHTYSSTGTFQAKATLTDTGGFTNIGTQFITVTTRPVNTVAITVNTTSPAISTPVSFTITPTAVSGAAATTNVKVDFGDGSTVDLGAITAATTVLHTYTSTGTYQVKATLTDAAGSTSIATQFISVGAAAAITVTLTASPSSPTAGNDVVFTAAVTLPTGSTATISRYVWNFGDTNTEETTTNTTRHPYSNAGTYVATVTVTTSDGNTGTGTVSVTVG